MNVFESLTQALEETLATLHIQNDLLNTLVDEIGDLKKRVAILEEKE